MAAALRVVPPPRLKHFVVTEKLGQGTYATVYKAFRKVRLNWLLKGLYITAIIFDV